MKTAFRLVALLLLISILFNGVQFWQARENDKASSVDRKVMQESISRHQGEADSARARISALEQDRKIYTDSARTQQRARVQEIKAFRTTIAKLKIKVAPEIEANPDLSHLFSVQDSVIRKQSDLIDSLQIAHSAEIINLESQLKEKGNQVMIEQLKTKLWKDSVQSAEKEANQQRKRKGFWRITSGILVGGIVYLSLKD